MQACYNRYMQNVNVIENPVVSDALTRVRDKQTNTQTFRKYADIISFQLVSSVFSKKDLEDKQITSPIGKTHGNVLQTNFVFVTVLRAGLAMLPAVLNIFPSISVGFVGLKRDEQTAIAHEYYIHLPKIGRDTIVLLADPMLATGGSMILALEKISKFRPKEIRLISIVSAPEGIAAVHATYPEVSIITAAIDSHLNDKKYIVPGLGDFGDRYFATET